MAHPNEELLRRGYGAFAKGDLDTVMSIFDENIVWHRPGGDILRGTSRAANRFGSSSPSFPSCPVGLSG